MARGIHTFWPIPSVKVSVHQVLGERKETEHDRVAIQVPRPPAMYSLCHGLEVRGDVQVLSLREARIRQTELDFELGREGHVRADFLFGVSNLEALSSIGALKGNRNQ